MKNYLIISISLCLLGVLVQASDEKTDGQAKQIAYWKEHGVTFVGENKAYIDPDVILGEGTFVGHGVHVLNGSTTGKNCRIEAFSIIDNASLEDNVIVRSHCVVKDAHLSINVQIGPFAHIHNNSTIGEGSILGNFVEVDNTTIGNYTKARHLTYLGWAQIGSRVNFGAGTITCNYNGVSKLVTHIGDNVFIGSNNTLVAPITIGDYAYTAAGSTITHNVPPEGFAIGRSRQVTKEGYATTLRERFRAEAQANNN